jgi:hypothetical protein
MVLKLVKKKAGKEYCDVIDNLKPMENLKGNCEIVCQE